jgi:predicted benzoate:H+ symporter BenE
MTNASAPGEDRLHAPGAAGRKLRFDRMEWAGAFGDLGTLVPFLIAYIGLAGIDPGGLLVTFGAALIATGVIYRTPFPVQPMKAAGAIVATQAAAGVAITVPAIHAAALATGVVWLVLGLTGAVRHVARFVGRPVAHGLVLGLGVAFMLEGIAAMAGNLWLALPALLLALLLSGNRAIPAMFALLALGAIVALVSDPTLAARLAALRIDVSLPRVTLAGIDMDALVVGLVFIALPQLPLTLGNAIVAVTEANNRLFADRRTSESRVAVTTGLMNIFAGSFGGVPICHGAGGLAAQVRFGARSGGAPVLLGGVLLALGLFASTSVGTLLELFPRPLLGVLLFLAGLQLASGAAMAEGGRRERLVLLGTAAFAIWNVAAAFVFGIVALALARRGWPKL